MSVSTENLGLLKNEIKALLQLFPHGLRFAQFHTHYKEFYGKNFNSEDYHFHNLFVMFESLTDIVTTVKCKLVVIKEHLKGVPKETLIFDRSDKFLMSRIGKDVSKGDFYQCQIPCVYDMSKFWIVIRPKELVVFQEHLQRHYHLDENRIAIPRKKIKLGLQCIIKNQDTYYRALINHTLLISNERVRVFCVDYGTIVGVNVTDVFYMTEFVASVPRFAMRASLYNVQPLKDGHPWVQDEVARFQKMIHKVVCFAKICEINYNNGILHVALREFCGHHREYINDILVKSGIAGRSRKVSDDTSYWYGNYQAKKIYMHLYPTFEEIEEGKVPSSLSELEMVKPFARLNLLFPNLYADKSDELKD